MAERNDVNIKVGVTGAKKALDELTKVLDSYSKKEKAQQQLAHQAEINQLKQKEANTERLHKGRMLKEAERFKQALNNARIESVQLTNRLKMIQDTAKTEANLADQAAKSQKARNAQVQSDLNLQHATQRAILETTTRTAEATGRQEVATLRVAKAQNDVLRTEERAGAATNSRIASEVRLQSTKDKAASQSQQNILREQNLTERLNNTRLIGINKIALEERRVIAFTSQEERRARAEALRERLAASREAYAAERMEMARTRFAQQQQDRETRLASQRGGFFGGILGPQLGGAVEALGRLNLAFMVVTNSIRPFTDAIQFSIQSFARYETASIGFNLQLMNMGKNISEGNRIVREFNDGISDPTAVMRAVQMMAPMNLSYQKQIDLINAIRDGVVSMGGDVNEQLPLMVLAIRRGSSELLDNMGVTKNADEVYKEFAASIGKKVKELRDDEKQMALVNAVIKENSKVSGLARQSADTLQGSMNRLQTTARELGTNIGSHLAPGIEQSINLFERLAAAAARALPRRESDIEMLRRQYPTKESARAALTSAQQMVTGTQARLNATRQTFERRERELFPNNPAASSFNIIQNQLREEIRGLEAGLQIATNTRNQVGRLMMEYINTEQGANRQAFEKAGPLIKPPKSESELEKERKAAERARKAAERESRREARHAEAEAKKREREAARLEKAKAEAYSKSFGRRTTLRDIPDYKKGGRFQAFTSDLEMEQKRASASNNDYLASLKQVEIIDRKIAANQGNITKATEERNKAQAERYRLQNLTTVMTPADVIKQKKQINELGAFIEAREKEIANYKADQNELVFDKSVAIQQRTADFLYNAYSVAFSLIQGDWMAVAAQIGNTLKDSIIKSLSETKAVQDAIKPLTDALATAIAGIIKGISAFVMANPIVLLLAGLSAGVAAIMMNAGKAAEEQAKKIQDRVESIERLIPKVEKTTRTERQEKLAELQADLPGLRKKLAEEEAKRGTRFFNKAAYDKALYAVQVAETGVIRLSDAIANDLNDPLSDAAKAAKAAADAIELMTKRSESFAKVASLNDDLEDKIFNQTIDRLVQEGKITKEEGEKRKVTQEIIRERSDLVSKAYEESRGFMNYGGIGMSKGTFEAAFGKFRQGDIAGASAMLATIGVTENETQNVIQLFKNIEEYLTGKGASANMPGSSPDKPMYTQVVNVRDFREAFPDSAYFRAPSSTTARSLNGNATAFL